MCGYTHTCVYRFTCTHTFTYYSESGIWKNTRFKIKTMHLAYVLKIDYMRSLKHSKVGYIALLKAVKLEQVEYTVGKLIEAIV